MLFQRLLSFLIFAIISIILSRCSLFMEHKSICGVEEYLPSFSSKNHFLVQPAQMFFARQLPHNLSLFVRFEKRGCLAKYILGVLNMFSEKMSPNRACLFPLSHNSKLYIAMIIKKIKCLMAVYLA